mmetsp:Transcript_15498/g.39045  ORF Transcript_15498/g.39045 Transcript_15498/m.39045 type:complete len:240 (-) Transcript_15498:289-1008(-)
MQSKRPTFFVSAFVFLLVGFASAFSSSATTTPATAVALSLAATNDNSSMADSSSPQQESSATTKSADNSCETGDMLFGRFVIPKASIFCRSKKAAAFVNLRPIVPGHVLIIPNKIVPHMADLEEDEYQAVWGMVRTVQKALKEAYPNTTAFNVAVQDGRAAGQSVPHVHVHVLPRSGGDFERNDDVYDAFEAWAPTESMASTKKKTDIEVPDDADRIDRTPEIMADEAAMYRSILENAV